MSQYLEKALEFKEDLTAWRRHIHQNPEVGEDLPETKAYVLARLAEMGIEAQVIDRSGILVQLGDPNRGKCIMVRCDMDALPIQEETDLPFASTNGCMHACGHDLHATVLLGAAKLLKERESELNGCVKLLWQPAEEVMTGAQLMIDGGVLENPHVDAAITMHCDCFSDFSRGDITILNKGLTMASNDIYRITVEGVGTHGAFPNQGVDPIVCGANIVTSLQEIIAREIKAKDQVVITQGSFHAGIVPNVIPGEVVIEGTIRTFDKDVRAFVKQRAEEIVSGIGSAFRCKARVEWLGGCQPLINDPELCDDAKKYISELLGEERFVNEGGQAYASEDFSNFIDEIPGIQLFLVVGSIAEGAKYAMHNPHAVFDEEQLPVGASVLAQVADRWLEEH